MEPTDTTDLVMLYVYGFTFSYELIKLLQHYKSVLIIVSREHVIHIFLNPGR